VTDAPSRSGATDTVTAETSLRIRPAKAADASDIADLAGQLGYPAEPADVAARRASFHSDSTILVAECDGAVVGWMHLHERRTLVAEPAAEVLGLVVAVGWRGRGIGRALMGRAEGWAGERGLSLVRLNSAVRRDGAHAFYEALGYSESKRQIVFTKRLER
jgi:GNAT superfamily N-acetyltransferase